MTTGNCLTNFAALCFHQFLIITQSSRFNWKSTVALYKRPNTETTSPLDIPSHRLEPRLAVLTVVHFDPSLRDPSSSAALNPTLQFAMTQSDLDVLLEMGFERERAELAVKKSGGLQGALTWLENTQDTPLDELKAAGASGKAAANKDGENSDDEGATQAAITALETNQEAKSLVCNECSKMFRSQATAEFHAAKSYVLTPPDLRIFS